jgi:hypothetical protein
MLLAAFTPFKHTNFAVEQFHRPPRYLLWPIQGGNAIMSDDLRGCIRFGFRRMASAGKKETQ